MCSLKNKLLVYDYLIGKTVDYDSKKIACQEEESLSTLTSVKLMKILYIVCLLSVKAQNNLKDTLFNLFDNFYAYPKGPVEEDVYNNKSVLLRFEMGYKEGRNSLKKCKTFSLEQIAMFDQPNDGSILPNDDTLLNEIYKNNLGKYTKMIDKSFEVIKSGEFPELSDVQCLVELTHLELWQEAYYSINKYIDTRDLEKLKKECNKLCERIKVA